jgi:hypothetical protein
MTYTELDNLTTVGLREILQFPSMDTPIFYPLFLFVVFIVFTLIMFFRELGREGRGNMLSALAIAGYVTTALSVAMSLLALIQYEIVIIVFVISLAFQVLFLLTKKD